MKLHPASPLLVFALFVTGLPAQTMTFAQFTQARPKQKLLVFDNDRKRHHSISATFDTANVYNGVDVDFSFNSDLVFSGALAALNGPQKADFIMESKTDDKAVRIAPSLLLQPIDSGFMEFKLETPVDGKDLLLKLTFSEVSLFTSNSPGLELAVGKPEGESQITYSSDFIDFDSVSPASWAIALSDIDPSSHIGADGALKDFSASGMGAFQGDPTAIPEPKTYGMIVGLASLAAVLLRRQRTRFFRDWKFAK